MLGSRRRTCQPETSASGGWAISTNWQFSSELLQFLNSPKMLTSLIHAQPGATLSRMLYAAKSPFRPYSALRSSGLYQSGICQSVAESQFVIGTVGFSFV